MKALSRISGVILAACLLGLSAFAQNQFHWQWQKMEEDSFWQRPIVRQIKNISTMQAIVDAEVKSMRADKEFFGDTMDAELWDLAANESYEWVDLDGDGIPELITGGFGVDQCGGTGNCILQVFRHHGKSFELLLYSREESMMIDRSGPKPLLILYVHESLSEGNLEVYNFPRNGNAKLVHSYGVTWGDFTHAFRNPHLEPQPLKPAY